MTAVLGRSAFIFSFFISTFSFSQCVSNIGVYYWGGQIHGVDTSQIISNAKDLADSLKVNTIRIALVSNDDNVYKNTGTCLLGKNLTYLASRPDFNAIITDPQFSTVILTAYDWTSFGDCTTQNFVDTAFYTPANTAAIELEYTNLANYLKQFTTKQFIISNWEGDNAVYCGAAYYYPNCASAPAALLGFKKWMQARATGINAASASNVKVGIEFCNVHSLENLSKPSVLNDVIPNVYADYYLYSGYESFNISANQLALDIDYIRTKLTGFGKDPNALLIGEMGFGKNNWGGSIPAADSLQNTITVIKQKNIPYAITWVLIDSPSNFGMYDSMGVITPSGTILKNNVCQITQVSSIKDEAFNLQLSPNPNAGEFELSFVSSNEEKYEIQISNALGQIFYSVKIENNNSNFSRKINLRNIFGGVYFVTIKSDSKRTTKKLIISDN
jgi:hypothetical protein